MRIIEDAIAALNFRHIGKALAKRPAGMVAGTFAIIVVLYTVVFGMWYSAITGDFIDAFLEVSKPYLPTFTITNGTLAMQSPEPFILTHQEVYKMVADAIVEVDKKRSGGKNVEYMDMGVIEAQANAAQNSFCLVMDTTGTYSEKINPQDYSKYAVVTKDTIEAVDRVRSMPGNAVPIKDKIQQDLIFTPDSVDNLIGPMKRISTISIILGLVIYTPIRFLVKALIGVLVGWIVILITKREISFDVLYKISLYSLAPVVLLAVIYRLWIPAMPGFMLLALYFLYIIMAVLSIPKPQEDSLKKEKK